MSSGVTSYFLDIFVLDRFLQNNQINGSLRISDILGGNLAYVSQNNMIISIDQTALNTNLPEIQ